MPYNPAKKYEGAYMATGGFYSGINAATMGLLGGMPESKEKHARRNRQGQIDQPMFRLRVRY